MSLVSGGVGSSGRMKNSRKRQETNTQGFAVFIHPSTGSCTHEKLKSKASVLNDPSVNNKKCENLVEKLKMFLILSPV